jgi:Tfp pilus assembly protein PilF
LLPLAAQRCLKLAVLGGVPAAVLVGLASFAYWSSLSRFLPSNGAAQWIHYPVPPRIAIVTDRSAQRAVFLRSFELAVVPAQARLTLRAFKDCAIELNGHALALPSVEDWKQVRTCEVAAQLRAGSNAIRAVVANDIGPPLLWLVLEGPGWSVASDDQWRVSLDGAAEGFAHPAGQPLPVRRGNPAWGGSRTLESLQTRLPTLLLYALVSAGVLFLAQKAGWDRLPRFLLLTAVLLWLVLFSNNLLATPPFAIGFDAAHHLKYIRYLLEHRRLPLANEGWEMHHPPLFYVLAACLLGGFGPSPSDGAVVLICRLIGLAAGLAALAAVAACLRLLFPSRPGSQLAGLVVAAFLPVQVYTCHYLTNETLLMAFGAGAVYLALRVLRDERPSVPRHALLGLCLGAALLSKVTGIVVAGVVLLVLAGQLVARGERDLLVWLRGVGVTLLLTLLVSGWHYARVWAYFGRPLVGNYDSASGFPFWQEPGYGTAAYLLHFGRVLQDPYFSGLHSLPDGLYSTFWGDGFCGGVNTWGRRLPWNYDLMAAGYLLALVPCTALLLGLVASGLDLVRRPTAEWFLLLGIIGGLASALLFQFVRYPYYGHGRAGYQLTVLVPVCALAARGFGVVARLGRVPAVLFAVLLGMWACTAYTSFWIMPSAANTYNWVGRQLLDLKRAADAERSFRQAIAVNPHIASARLSLAETLLPGRHRDQARQLIEEVLRDDPDDPDALVGMAMLLQAEGQVGEALNYFRRAGELAPDDLGLESFVGGLLTSQHQPAAAIGAYRQALRVRPSDPADHANLGLLLAQTGQIEEAVAQYRRALDLRPDHAQWLADLAWILATQKEPRFRAPAEAARLAEEACRRTEYRDVACLQALAAAQAAAGRYREARDTVQQAAQVAATARSSSLAPIEEQVRHYAKGELLHAGAPPWDKPYAPVNTLAVDE